MKLYFGYMGDVNNDMEFNWINNVQSWCKQTKKVEIEQSNFFCYHLDVDLNNNVKFEKDEDLIIDGCIFAATNQYNENNIGKYKNFILSSIGKGNFYGKYTLINHQSNELHIYNDYYGFNAFYYYVDNNNNFYFSNDIRLLLLNDLVPFIPNIKKCKRMLTISAIENDDFEIETFYQGIKKLQEGVHLSIRNKTIKIESVFHPNSISEYDYLKFTTKDEYFNYFRKTINHLIKQFIDAYPSEKIGVSLSGGIDSAVILASLIDLGYKNKVICYHASSKNSLYYSCNDSDIVKNLLNYLHVCGKIFYQNNGNSICNAIMGRDYIKNIDGPCPMGNDSFGYRLSTELKKDNVSLLFGGDGGDYLFTGTKYCYDMIRKNPHILSQNRNRILKQKKVNKFSYYIAPFIPIVGNAAYRRIFWGSIQHAKCLPNYFTKEFQLLNKKKTNKCYFNKSKKLKFWSRRFIYDMMFPKAYADDEHFDGYNVIHPLLDKTIYDLCQRIPPYIHYDITKGHLGDYIVQKRVLREAYKDILPDFIVNQKSKTNYAPSIILKFKREKDNLKKTIMTDEKLFLETYKIVEKDKFIRKLNLFFNNMDDPHFMQNLETKYIFTLIYLEIWFKEISKGKKWLLEQCGIEKRPIQNIDLEIINE